MRLPMEMPLNQTFRGVKPQETDRQAGKQPWMSGQGPTGAVLDAVRLTAQLNTPQVTPEAVVLNSPPLGEHKPQQTFELKEEAAQSFLVDNINTYSLSQQNSWLHAKRWKWTNN